MYFWIYIWNKFLKKSSFWKFCFVESNIRSKILNDNFTYFIWISIWMLHLMFKYHKVTIDHLLELTDWGNLNIFFFFFLSDFEIINSEMFCKIFWPKLYLIFTDNFHQSQCSAEGKYLKKMLHFGGTNINENVTLLRMAT